MPYGCFVTCFVESCPGQVVENSIKILTDSQSDDKSKFKKLTDQHQTKSDPKINAKKLSSPLCKNEKIYSYMYIKIYHFILHFKTNKLHAAVTWFKDMTNFQIIHISIVALNKIIINIIIMMDIML